MIVMPVMTVKPALLKSTTSRMNPKKLSPQRLLKPVVMPNAVIMALGLHQPVEKEAIVIAMTAGAERIVPRIIPVAGMEHGAVLGVTVNPAGVVAIVRKQPGRPAPIMGSGTQIQVQ